MEKFSVKKPFTVLVAVIAIIVLGIVSVLNMPSDLLPELSLPYLMVITAYPGASPERVEAEVSEPMENALGTISHVKNVSTVSYENYSLTQLEFEDGTDMDSAMVKVSSAIDQLSGNLPEECATPNILEISMDMIATMYVAVELDGADIYELTDYVTKDVQPYLERVEGVASISDVGLVDRTVQVELNKEKIDKLNDRILRMASDELSDAYDKLTEAKDKVDEGQKKVSEQQENFGENLAAGIFDELDEPAAEMASNLQGQVYDLIGRLNSLSATIDQYQSAVNAPIENAARDARTAYDEGYDKAVAAREAADAAYQAYQEASSAVTAAGDGATDEMKAAADAAWSAYEAASTEADVAAQEVEYLALALDLANSALSGRIDTASISADIGSVVSQLGSAAGAIDGTSMRALASAASTISGILPRVSSILAIADGFGGGVPASSGNVYGALNSVIAALDNVPGVMDTMEEAFAALTQGQLDAAVGFSSATGQLSSAESALDQALDQYEAAKEKALENANLDTLLTVQNLAGMIYAQNFSMPAGYIDDANDNSWLLKVGDEYENASDISNALLADIDGIGTVRLEDVADITVIDNADATYARLNGEQAVVLSIYKSSSAGTNEVSRDIKKQMDELMASESRLHIVPLMDQGEYITLIVNDIVQSMLVGAALAILILAIFLRDLRPTLLVGISIPLSVLFALVLMYFTDMSLNMMTLSGMSLGIGMLVDNSIVVIENVFRLRSRGVAAPRAAVQGARQVSGALVASTLTTVCVFFPMVFTEGTVRKLLVPLALSISFCLLASLVVALTVVPAASSTVFRSMKTKGDGAGSKIYDLYSQSLRWCLQHKLISIIVPVILLGICVARLINMGIVILPEMTGNNIQVSITTPETDDRHTSYEKAGQVMEAISGLEGVLDVGVMDAASTTGLISSFAGSSDSYGSYVCYVTMEGGMDDAAAVQDLCTRITEATAGIDCEVSASAGGMSDMGALMSPGLTVNIYGDDLDQLVDVSEDVMGYVEGIEGFENISNGTEDAEQTLHLVIDKDKAMASGITVAQIYAAIAERMTTSANSTRITSGGYELQVVIKDNSRALTRENILDLEIEGASMTGQSGMDMGGMDASALDGLSFDMEEGEDGQTAGFDFFGGSSEEEDTAENESENAEGEEIEPQVAEEAAGNESAADAEDADSEETSADTKEDKQSSEDKDSEEKTSGEEKEETSTVHKLGEFAYLEETEALSSVTRQNLTRYLSVTAATAEGYNTALLSRELETALADYQSPYGIRIEIEGETSQINDMIEQMVKLMLLALLFIYLVMVAQFQSLLSPFIVMFTIPLAFTGGMLGLIFAGEQLSMLSLMGFLILMGTVVNNGIVFVDYTNQLRIGGLDREDALVATGTTRMRPIFMTALTTILAMLKLIFGKGMGSQMGSGMAIVIVGGLVYATIMTLYIVPVMYDIFFKKPPLNVDVGDDLDDTPDDAAEFLRKLQQTEEM